MDRDGLIAQFRREADDKVGPAYLWSDEDVTAWLDEAQEEAAIRARLIKDTDSPALCQIPITENQGAYTLHPKVLHIAYAQFKAAGDTREIGLKVVTRDFLNRTESGWRSAPPGIPRFVVNDPGQRGVLLVPAPAVAGIVHMEVNRLPMDSIENTDTPEIPEPHHRHLVDWALFKAFSKPDAETIDPNRAAQAESRFTAYFGLRKDAHLGQDYAADQPHHNQAIW